MNITHVLLDIEGTTCPVSFVSEVLFPYASASLEPYLEANQGNADIAKLMREVEIAWREDSHPEARGLLQQQDAASTLSVQALSAYLRQLIGRDIKLTPLKDLQGRIWRSGYASGELIAPLFADVPRALRHWRDDGFTLAVYSSGSVPAQQLLYGHCHEGDLTGLFSHWFDTCLLYTSPSPRDQRGSRMPSSA